MESMKSKISITALTLSLLLNVISLSALSYLRKDFNDLKFLLSLPSYDELLLYFRTPPAEEYWQGDVVDGRGWKVPEFPVSNKAVIFIRRTGLKIYIYIDKKDKIEHVFVDRS